MLPSTNQTLAPTISQSGCLKQSKRCPNYYNRVISSMEGKLKRQELLKVISQMEIIEKLPKQLLEELCRIFKIEEANAPHGLLIQQFKNKMVDIFIQEAQFFVHLETAIWITFSFPSSGHSGRTSQKRCISSSPACGINMGSIDNASR